MPNFFLKLNSERFSAIVEAFIAVVRFAVPAMVVLYITTTVSHDVLVANIMSYALLVLGSYLLCHWIAIYAEKSDWVKSLRDPKARTKAMVEGAWCEIYSRDGQEYYAVMLIERQGDKIDLNGYAFEVATNERAGAWSLKEGSVYETENRREAGMIYTFVGRATNAQTAVVAGLGVMNFDTRDQNGAYTFVNGFFSDKGGNESVDYAGFRLPKEACFNNVNRPLDAVAIKNAICGVVATSNQAEISVKRICPHFCMQQVATLSSSPALVSNNPAQAEIV